MRKKISILQKDGNHSIRSHIPCGIVTSENLRKFADIAEKYNAKAIKITGATRFSMIGLKEKDVNDVYEELSFDKRVAIGKCVKNIRSCPGIKYCKIGKQDSLKIGMLFDKKYYALQMPGKLNIAVSGCEMSCSESWVKDIGILGEKNGWTIIIGGNAGKFPSIGHQLIQSIDDDNVLHAVDKIINFYKKNAKNGERIGKMIERVGLDSFSKTIS